jgi:hypothetical protein
VGASGTAEDELDGDYMDADYAVYFKYNSEGIRTEKITDAGNHEYILNGNQIIGEWIANRSKMIVYLYDENGAPIGILKSFVVPVGKAYFENQWRG